MERPNRVTVERFYIKAFGRKPYDTSYFDTWVQRFESPQRVWNNSDIKRRRVLKQMFPSKFSKLPLDANLYDKEYSSKKYWWW